MNDHDCTSCVEPTAVTKRYAAVLPIASFADVETLLRPAV